MAALALVTLPSLHAADKTSAPVLKLHPKVFSMIDCWISDSEAPVVTEFNLEALEANGNQFYVDEVKTEDGWTKSPGEDGNGFFRYRVLEAKDDKYKVEFQSNGGGTLTTAVIIDCVIDKREINVEGKPKTIRVLRVNGFTPKDG